MIPTDVLKVNIWEDTGLWVAARIRGNAAALITQASLTTITYAVYDVTVRANPGLILAATPLTISAVVFDTLQTTDARWNNSGGDATGYNFAHAIGSTVFPSGDHVYRIEYYFTPASGAQFAFVVEALAQQLVSL
jgi:hypothetical protein